MSYIIDYKNINGGEVEVLEEKPEYACVELENKTRLEVYFVAFKDNALKVDGPEGQVKQCECVLFPATLNTDDWVLFVETKYTPDFKVALDKEIDYPNTMINQVISTVDYFRKNGILPSDKLVCALVSFPRLLEGFSEAFFSRSDLTIEEISIFYKIKLRLGNQGEIRSNKRIKI